MSDNHPGQHRLARVQVVNWGTFDGYHQFPVARRGFLITGNSGSGKSTLLRLVAGLEPLDAGRIAIGGREVATGDGGVPPGKYFVKISSTVEDKENWVEDAMPIPPSKELLPEKYNATTELTLEVPSGAGELEQNYDLQ